MPADQRRDARWNSSSGRPPGETAQAARTHWLAARCVSAIARVICSNFLGGSRRSSLIARILVGTACWADPSLITTKRFYPKDASKLEPMLQHYATRFSMAEVDSSYYALPSSVNCSEVGRAHAGRLHVRRKPGSECTFKDKRPEMLCPKNTEPKPLAARLCHRRCKPVELISSPSPLRKARCPVVDFLTSADCNDQATPDSGVAKHRAGIGAIDSRLALRSENLSSLIPTRT